MDNSGPESKRRGRKTKGINMEIASLEGLDMAAAREYILGFISTLKLTEKCLDTLREDASKWERRAALAREQGSEDLMIEAEKEKERVLVRITGLENEADELRAQIANLRQQLAVHSSRERSIDPDLLEQELLILTGRLPGEEKEAARDRAFEKLEKESSADAALEALKAKMTNQ